MYLLDTNACIALINASSPRLLVRFREHTPEAFVMSSVVIAELLFGAQKSARAADNTRVVRQFVSPFVHLPFDDACAIEYASLRAELERMGTPIGANDLMIAATALAHDAVLITRNTREFARVPNLRYENWQDA
jgi:tRNA(fMet)-specific endonuclease VapC